MVKKILANWSVMRWLRLLAGSIILAKAIIQNDPVLALLASFLLLLTIANAGCCGGNTCNVNYTPRKKRKQIEF